MHRFPKHQKIIEKYSIEFYTAPPPHSIETIISKDIPELIIALKEKRGHFFFIKDHLIPKIKEVKKELHPPMIADWSGEGYFLNIYPSFVTSGFWYAEEDPDYENPDYRGKDTISTDDFLLICDFYLDFLKEEHKWAFQIWDQIDNALPNLFQEEIKEKRLLINHSFSDTNMNISISYLSSKVHYYFNFPRTRQSINVSHNWEEIRKKGQSTFFKINTFDPDIIIPIFKKIIFNVINDQKINFLEAEIQLIESKVQHLDFQNKESYDTMLNELRKGQSYFCSTNGSFKLQVLETTFSDKNFLKVLQSFSFVRKKENTYLTSDGLEIYYSIISEDIALQKFSLYILSRGKINSTHYKISFLGKWKITL